MYICGLEVTDRRHSAQLKRVAPFLRFLTGLSPAPPAPVPSMRAPKAEVVGDDIGWVVERRYDDGQRERTWSLAPELYEAAIR
jgi:hypothetical protein